MGDQVDGMVSRKFCRHRQEFDVPKDDCHDSAHFQVCEFLACETPLAIDRGALTVSPAAL